MPHIRTISQLQEISSDSLGSGSYFETSHCLSAGLYVSRKISKEEMEKLASDSAIKTLTDKYGLTDGCNIGSINTNVDKILNKECTFNGKKTFNDIPDIGPKITNEDNSEDYKEAEDYYNKLDLTDLSANGNKAINAKMLNSFTSINFAPQINSEFGFGTLLNNTNNNKSAIHTALDGITLRQQFTKVFKNEYIFKINQKENISNEWISPASGIFTCYGWLGEAKSNAINNSARWVALEAYNSKIDIGNWSMLQLQPFIPNNFCSYVSFSFPVKAGLKLRIKTGFTVSTNSDKYFNAQGSLTNHVLNAFVGGVYTSSLDSYLMDAGNNNSDSTDTIYIDSETFNKTLEDLDKQYDNKYIDNHELSNALNDFVSIDKLTDHLASFEYIDDSELNNSLSYLSNDIDKKIDSLKINESYEDPLSVCNYFFKHAFDIKKQCVKSNGNTVQIYLSAARTDEDMDSSKNNSLSNDLRFLDSKYYDYISADPVYNNITDEGKHFAKIHESLNPVFTGALTCKIHATYIRQPNYKENDLSGILTVGSTKYKPVDLYSNAIAYINEDGTIDIDFESIFPHLKNFNVVSLKYKYPGIDEEITNYTINGLRPFYTYALTISGNSYTPRIWVQSIVISGTYLLKSAKE